MNRKVIRAGLFAFVAFAGSAAQAASLEGVWRNRNGTVDVRVAPCGSRLCGTVIAAHGDAVTDARAGGVDRLVGTRVLKDFAHNADGSWHGSAFVPELKHYLASRIRFADPNVVEVTGCALGGLICKTKVWRRIS